MRYSFPKAGYTSLPEEQGIALVMSVFVIALVTVLVMGTLREVEFYQRSSKAFTESVQADFVLKSALNLAQVLLEAPKQEGISEDWLGEPWALVAAAPALPIQGFAGEPRLMIVDEDGKIDLSSISGGQSFYSRGNESSDFGAGSELENFWKNVLREVFAEAGFQREQFSEEEFRTLGNVAFGPSDQVAILHDWIDSDSRPHSSAAFDGEGIESSANAGWFYNRRLRLLSEMALVPGMTLERLARIAPYVRVSQDLSSTAKKINVNTAPLPVLLALGFPEAQAIEMIQERTNLPITSEILRTLTEGDAQLQRATKVQSSEFSVYARVIMPNVTRWLKAIVTVRGGQQRRTTVRSMEWY